MSISSVIIEKYKTLSQDEFEDWLENLGKKFVTASIQAGTVTVGTGSTKIFDINQNRIVATIVNDSANAVYLSKGGVAVASQGIRLNASGGSYTFGLATDDPYTGDIFGIASGSSVVVTTEQ